MQVKWFDLFASLEIPQIAFLYLTFFWIALIVFVGMTLYLGK